MEVRGRHLAVGVCEDVPGRHDVEYRQPEHRVGVIEGHPMRDPGATVVTGDREPAEAERAHDADLIGCHRALAVGGAVCGRGGFVAVAVAA